MENPETTNGGGKGGNTSGAAQQPSVNSPKWSFFVPDQICLMIDHPNENDLSDVFEANEDDQSNEGDQSYKNEQTKGVIYNYFNGLGVIISEPSVTRFANVNPTPPSATEGLIRRVVQMILRVLAVLFRAILRLPQMIKGVVAGSKSTDPSVLTMQSAAASPQPSRQNVQTLGNAATANAQSVAPYTSVARLNVAFTDRDDAEVSDFQGLINYFLNATENQTAPIRLPGNIAIQAASPNWYFSASQDAITTGGPGSEPEPWNVKGKLPKLIISNNLWISFLELIVSILMFLISVIGIIWRGLVEAQAQNAASWVNVVILDTAPSQTEISDCAKFNTHLQEINNNPNFHIGYRDKNKDVLGLLPDETGKLGVAVGKPPSTKHYRMNSHGLFIAGIIHQLAPQATIHLLQILNAYGVGTLDALIQALGLVGTSTFYTDHNDNRVTIQSRNIILNCSLTIGFNEALYEEFMTNTGFKGSVIDAVGLFKSIMDKFSAANAFATVNNSKVKIFAAAGNDSTLGSHKPARYPARYDSVSGVAALDRDENLASYSNQADTRLDQGIMILGGSPRPVTPDPFTASSAHTLSDEKLVGYFVDPEFPTAVQGKTLANTSGWAYWSGTSFATAVMSGFMARMISRLGASSPENAESWLRFAQEQFPAKIQVEQKFVDA